MCFGQSDTSMLFQWHSPNTFKVRCPQEYSELRIDVDVYPGIKAAMYCSWICVNTSSGTDYTIKEIQPLTNLKRELHG